MNYNEIDPNEVIKLIAQIIGFLGVICKFRKKENAKLINKIFT